MKLDNEPFSAKLISRALLWCTRIRTSASDASCGMKPPRRIFHKAAALPAAVLLLCAGMNPVHADDNYYYCKTSKLTTGLERAVYFSAIFSGKEASRGIGDVSIEVNYGHPFMDYVEQQYNVMTTYYEVICWGYSSSYQEVKNKYDDSVRFYRRGDYKVVQTNWSPDDFTDQALQDFNITVSSGRQEVRVCVRDHECEDGDQVRVSVNGNVLFSGEIDNQWACSDVPVRRGSNRIEMYAINGTGGKGEHCSHRNVNTGEIQVGGENTQTQSWRHRGGAGSSANIVVEID